MNRIKTIIGRAFPLALGLALSMVMIARICFDLSYDGFYADIDRIYCIRTTYVMQGKASEYGQTSGAVAPGFKQYIPGVEEATRMTGLVESLKYTDEDGNTIAADRNLMVADTSFFHIFNRRIIAGDPEEILSTPAHAMVSESFAEKLGGPDKAIGMTIRNYDLPDVPLTVGGIFEDFPDNGTISCDILLSMESMPKWSTRNWEGNDRYIGYVKLAEGVDPESLGDAIRLMQEKNQSLDEMEKMGISISYFLSPLDKMHTSDTDVRNSMIMFGVVSALLLVISILNYILSTISEAVRRSREFATRKCFGAKGRDIYGALLREAAAVVASALVMAVMLTAAAAPVIENIMGVSVSSMLVPLSWIVIAATVLLVLLGTALIPGWLYSRIPVTDALRSWSDSRRRWKHLLLVTQFTVNVFMFGMLLAITAQYEKMLNGDPGYDCSGIQYIYTSGLPEADVEACADEISALAGVIGVERCSTLPLQRSSGNNISIPGNDNAHMNIADQYFATEGFFRMFGIKFLEGSEPSGPRDIAISRSCAGQLGAAAGWKDGAVGKQVLMTEHSGSGDDVFTICGIYEDYLIGSFNNPDTRPSVRFWAEKPSGYVWFDYLLIKSSSVNQSLTASIENTVRDIVGGEREIEVLSYEEQMDSLYSDNRKNRDTFIIGCIFSLLISIFGLTGYIGGEANRRSKEIAIRKINGAQSSDITAMFAADSLRMAAVAIIIGDILLYLAASGYLTLFPDRVSLSAWNFVAADLLLVLLAVAAAMICSFRISRANPVDSIKNE